jgi:hypothetical protein
MPRQARLDSPGTLHHVMIRGIERQLPPRELAGRVRKIIEKACAKGKISREALLSGNFGLVYRT